MPDRPEDEATSNYGPPDEAMTYDGAGDEAGRGRMVLALAVVMVVAAVAILYVVFQQGVRKGGRNAPPVIIAESGPEKIKPEDPGGLDVPHQDKLVFDRVSGETSQRVEKLLPEPEEPIDLSGLRTSQGEEPAAEDLMDPVDVQPADAEPVAQPPATSPEADVIPTRKPVEQVADTRSSVVAEIDAPQESAVIKEAQNIGELIESLPQETVEEFGSGVAEMDTAAVSRASGNIPSATSGAYVVQVSSVKGAELASKDWEKMLNKYGDLLKSLRPDIQMADLGSKGVYYRLRIGPFDTKEGATRLCNSLKARGQDCLVRKT
jgi:hypothetical protein